jgi:hypothetical protein
LQDVRQAITETLGVANTPLYLDVLVQNLHRRNKPTGGADLNKYRKLARDLGGYEVSHASETVISDDGVEADDGKPIEF